MEDIFDRYHEGLVPLDEGLDALEDLAEPVRE